MSSSEKPSFKDLVSGTIAKCPKPVLALLVLLTLGVLSFVVWKFSSNLVDESSDVFDEDKPVSVNKSNETGKSSGTQNSALMHTTSLAHDLDSDFSNASFSKSRMIAMAIARQEQMPRLWDHKKWGDASGESLDSLRIDVKEEDAKELFKKNSAELAENTRAYGADHPLTFQTELARTVLMERLHENNDELLMQTARKWEKLAETLKSANVKSPDGSTSSKAINSVIKSHKIRRVCRWAHDTGEILAILLWAHGENAEAKKVVSQIPTLDRLLPFELLDGTVLVHKLLTLARLCASQNEYVAAKQIISVAKDMAESQRSAPNISDAHSKAMCLLEEARLSLAQRDYTAAAELAQKTDLILSKSAEMDTAQSDAIRADILELLARALSAFPGKISEAIENQEKCLSLRQKSFGKNGVFCAATSLDLARMLRLRLLGASEKISEGAPDAIKSRELLDQIVQVCKINQKSDSEVLRADRNPGLLLSQAYYELGMLQASCGNFSAARESIRQSCDLVQGFTEPLFTPYKIASLDAMACLELHNDKIDQARKTVLKSSKFLDSYVADVLPQLSLSEQIAFSDNIEKHMNTVLAVCRDDASLSELYAQMMRWKGFLIEQFRLRAQMIKEKGSVQMRALLTKHQQLSSKILTGVVNSAQSGSVPELGGANQERKEAIERQINSRLRGKQSQSLDITPLDLQSVLAPNEALLDLYEFVKSPWEKEARYGAVVVCKSKLRFIDLGASEAIDSAINSWRSYDGLRSVLVLAKNKSEPEMIGPWMNLAKLLYRPLCEKIPDNVSRLWVSDESALARLPWSVLMSTYSGSREFQVAQIDSPRELINLQEQTALDANRNEMLIVGGIDYSKHLPPAPPLKHALNELNEIKSVVEAFNYKCIVQSDFVKGASPTRKNIFDTLGRCQLAHLVTHGFFNDSESVSTDLSLPSRNPLIESGLLISRGSPISAQENGFLTAEDLLDANLQGCRLITLSACETARGREVSSQGVLGLRSALMGAGADSVMLSLWPVPDKPTSELMKVFYKRMLEGDQPVLALRAAQAAVRNNPEWQAPYYWAAWILVGDGWKKLARKN